MNAAPRYSRRENLFQKERRRRRCPRARRRRRHRRERDALIPPKDGGGGGGRATYLVDGRSWQIETNCAAEDTAQTVLQLLLGFRGVALGTSVRRLAPLLVRLGEALGLVEVLAYRRRVGGGRRRRGDLLRDAARRCRLVARVRHVACFGVFP